MNPRDVRNYRHFVQVDVGDTDESKRGAVERNYGRVVLVGNIHQAKLLYFGVLKKCSDGTYSDSFDLGCFEDPKSSSVGTLFIFGELEELFVCDDGLIF